MGTSKNFAKSPYGALRITCFAMECMLDENSIV
jgi:hypothetical protein